MGFQVNDDQRKNRVGNHQGFRISLKNGWGVSVQWGTLNLSANSFDDGSKAEIACIPEEQPEHDHRLKWYEFEKDEDTKGFVSADELLEWLDTFKKLPNPIVYCAYHGCEDCRNSLSQDEMKTW